MSSDEIIHNIIREIVIGSSATLKARHGSLITESVAPPVIPVNLSDEKSQVAISVNGPVDEKTRAESKEPPIPSDPLPEEARQIFVSGIKSYVSPFHVTETLAAFMIRAVVLNPKYAFRIEQPLGKSDVDRLIKVCSDLISTNQDTVMETIKMQVYFDTNFPAQNDFLHKEKLTRIHSYAPLLRDIIEIKTKTMSSYEALYRKIVQLVLVKSHVGQATDVRVVREATAALESVFPQSELNAFISLPRNEKEAQLAGLSQLVTGIRLFNKQLGKGGESIENLPELCGTELRELTLLLHEHTQKTELLVQTFKSVLDYADSTKNSEVTAEIAEQLRGALIFRRQYLIYLDALQEQVMNCRTNLVQIAEKFDESMRELKVTCKAKTAVPVDQVYPHFIALSNLWAGWTDELFLLAFRRGIVDQLNYHAQKSTLEIPPLVKALAERFKTDIEPEILPEAEVIRKASETMVSIAMVNKSIEVLHTGNTTQYYKLPVEFGGFCPVALVDRDNLIVPGDKNLGLLRYKDKLYALGSNANALEFAKNPDRYLYCIVEQAKQHPHLVQLLHLHNYFPTVEALEKARSYTRQRLLGQMPMVAEIGCQVDTHIVDENVDSKYKWNEWDLRRHALLLANLKDKRTHTTQTDLSHFRRESETQYFQAKHGETQTKKSSTTTVPRTVHYFSGLRNQGRPIPNGMYVSPYSTRQYHFKVLDLSVDHDGGPVPYPGGAYKPKKVDQKSQ